MLLTANTHPFQSAESALHWWSNAHLVIGWKGHLAFAGETAGAASIAALAGELEQRRLAALCVDLSGVFGLFVWNRREQSWQVAGDNAGLYEIFHDRSRISTSFLELLAERAEEADLELDAVIEFIGHGGIFGGRTLVAEVERLQHDQIIQLRRTSEGQPSLTMVRKHLDGGRRTDPDFFVHSMERLAQSLRGRRVSIDITGGFDSRLLACLLSRQGLDFEAAMSGEPNSPDVALASQVAAELGVPFFVTRQNLDQLEEELPQVFRDGGGLTDIYKFHRDRQMALQRLARGVEVFVHGGAGALYKDFLVHHEFPRYGSRRVAVERFYDLRIAPVRLPRSYFTPQGLELAEMARARTLELYASFRAETNTETYKRIAYLINAPEAYGHQLSAYVNLGLDVVAPFLDYANAMAAMKLSAWSGFMHGWHRRLMTQARPDVAALLTTDGYSASSAPRHLPANIAGYAGNELRRLVSKASQRLIGRRLLAKAGAASINAPDFIPRLRAAPAFHAALETLKGLGILAPDLAPEQVREPHVGRILTLGLCLAYIEGVREKHRLTRPLVEGQGLEASLCAG